MPSLNEKAIKAIAVLAARRKTWSFITHGELAEKIGYPDRFIGGVLDRVGAWCFAHGKHSLALLVINDEGKPSSGLWKRFRGETDPEKVATSENYELRRLQLWREDWPEKLPSGPEEIAEAWTRVGPAT